jgi:CDP-diacylglycerol--glycerol-3-phosphate 3-phosphatidyltransferase
MKTKDYLTTLRVALSPLVMALILSNRITAAFCIYLVAAITDVLDGYFARKYKSTSARGEVFDALADFTLIYFAVFALGVVRESTGFFVMIIISAVLVVLPISIISIKKKDFSIPHFTSAKTLAVVVHVMILAYIANWQYAVMLLLIGWGIGIYTLFDYIVYGIKQKSL